MGAEDFHGSAQILLMGKPITGGTNSSCRRSGSQKRNFFLWLRGEIQKLLPQEPFNPVSGTVNSTKVLGKNRTIFHNGPQRIVYDHRRPAAHNYYDVLPLAHVLPFLTIFLAIRELCKPFHPRQKLPSFKRRRKRKTRHQ
jgi:hypothetical protein